MKNYIGSTWASETEARPRLSSAGAASPKRPLRSLQGLVWKERVIFLTGNFYINSGTIGNLELDQGVGKVYVNAYLRGTSKIEGGVGKLDINLLGGKDNYRIVVEKGVGSIKVDGNAVGNENIIGSGNSKVNIEGGVGEININFKSND